MLVIGGAEVGKQLCEVYPLCCAQFSDDAFIVSLLGGQLFYLVGHISSFRCSDILCYVAQIPSAAVPVIGVCARTYA